MLNPDTMNEHSIMLARNMTRNRMLDVCRNRLDIFNDMRRWPRNNPSNVVCEKRIAFYVMHKKYAPPKYYNIGVRDE